MREVLFGIVGLSSEARYQAQQRAQKRAEQRGIFVAGSHLADDGAFFVYRPRDQAETERIHSEQGRVLAWLGHVVCPQLELWPPARQLLSYLGQDAETRLAATDGLYALALYDGGAGRLSLASDPYGVYPLYYLQLPDGVLFGTSADLLILACPRRLSLSATAAAEYLQFHYCLGDKTLANEVKRVPQGRLLTLEPRRGTVRETTTFSYERLPRPNGVSDGCQVDDLVAALDAAVRRRLRHGHAQVCLLSGGYDSRAISGLLANLNMDFTTLTTCGDVGNLDDPECARLVADALDVSNTYIPLPHDYLAKYWREKCLLTDFSTTMHTWLMPLSLRHQNPGAVNLDGIAGDVALKGLLLRSSHLDLLEQNEHDELVDALMSHHAMGRTFTCALADSLRSEWSQRVRRSLGVELARWDRHPNALSFFILSNRTRRAIGASPCLLLEARLRNVAPFLDRDVLTQCMAVPPSAKLNGQLYREVIAAINPQLAELPSSNDKHWPDSFPRRYRPKLSVGQPEAMVSYLEEIETPSSWLRNVLDPTWVREVQRAAQADASARAAVFREVQCVAELALWLNTYGSKLDLSLT